jgi:hypothetical protein
VPRAGLAVVHEGERVLPRLKSHSPVNYCTINVNMKGDIYGEPKRQFVRDIGKALCQGIQGGMQPLNYLRRPLKRL